jgi:dTDP-4-amino-4,6-dideoxygalactose transaminase
MNRIVKANRREDAESFLYFPRATTAIYAALRSFSSSGKIIIPSTICLDPIVASHYANYEPVFIGIDGFQIDLKKTIQLLDSDPSINAILLPFLYGYPIEGLEEFWGQIRSREILVIEDLAQTLGPSHFASSKAISKVVTIYSSGKTKIIDHQRIGVAHTTDPEICFAMKSLRPPEFFISESSYEILNQQYRDTYKSFLSSREYEQDWKSFYQTVWNSDPRLFVPFMTTPLKISPHFDFLNLQSPALEMRSRRHEELVNLFLNFDGVFLPNTIDSHRPIWRTTVRLPAIKRDKLYRFMKSRGLFVSQWYKAMHRYVPNSLIQSSADLKTSELFEEEVLNFRIDAGMTDKNFQAYKSAIQEYFTAPDTVDQ